MHVVQLWIYIGFSNNIALCIKTKHNLECLTSSLSQRSIMFYSACFLSQYSSYQWGKLILPVHVRSSPGNCNEECQFFGGTSEATIAWNIYAITKYSKQK